MAPVADPAAPSAAPSATGLDSPVEDATPRQPKRRRISRACDDCRRKKIKCDGQQPCSSCAEFSSSCNYKVPSRRTKPHLSRPPSPASESLEARLNTAESIIRRFLPHVDLKNLESAAASSRPSTRSDEAGHHPSGNEREIAPRPSADGDKYIPLVENEDQWRFTDSGELDFHGTSSSAAFMSRITKHFPELMRYDSRIPFLPETQGPGISNPINAEGLNYDYATLPRRELALILCEYSFKHASCLLRIVHLPSFYAKFHALYDAQRTSYSEEEGRFVGLLYSILALGSMYDVDENDPSNPDHYNEAASRGYKFYLGARLYLQDLAECRDMTSLQALLFIIQFLQANGNLNSCYNMIGIALRSSLRMGLHRHLPNLRKTPIEIETRKRVFHTIRQLDIYLSTVLGLPIVLQARDMDQPLPVAIDDEYITEDAFLHYPHGTASITQGFNAHVKLMEILASVVEHVYPSRFASKETGHVTYMIDCGQLREVERKLSDWYHHLPATLRPGEEKDDVQMMRVQILLRFAYAHVQMMLYRPFMQFFSHQAPSDKSRDTRHQEFAAAGITVCRNIIQIGHEIKNQAVLIGSYWFIFYTQFLAVMCLVSYVSQNPDKPEAAEILSDAFLGKGSIAGLAQRSLAADRLSIALDAVFEQLPNRLGSGPQTTDALRSPPETQAISRGSANTVSSVSTPSHPLSAAPAQWSAASVSDPSIGDAAGMVMDTGVPATQILPGDLNPTSEDLATGRVMFPLSDPIAYPSVTAWLPHDDPTVGMSDDTMQLIIPDFFADLAGHMPQPPDAAFPGQDSTPNPASALLSLGHGGLLDSSIASIFDDMGPSRTPEVPRSTR